MPRIYFDKADMFYGANTKLHEFARQMRHHETECERLLWEKLNKKQLNGYRFRRQHPILYFVADFYCHKAKLIVEVDGGIHQLPNQYEYDKGRDFELSQFGLTVLRFTNRQILEEIDLVTNQIESFIQKTVQTAK
jgi:very-short-patch-repair endonuclease